MDFDTESTHDGETTNSPELVSSISLPTIIGASALTCEWERKETILLVEDEVFVRKAIAEALESAGYQVLSAESAAQAIRIRRECSESVDLLLADIVMPGIDGHELANEFRLLYPDVRILLMSGYASQLTTPDLSPYRKEYLAKPFSIPTLLKRVREVLDRDPFDFGASA
ncbi:MAG: response regulator [Candidatus Sulfotelmatobacter sp.]